MHAKSDSEEKVYHAMDDKFLSKCEIDMSDIITDHVLDLFGLTTVFVVLLRQ